MPLRLVDGWTIVESAISATLLLSPNQSTLRRLRHLGLAKLVFTPPKYWHNVLLKREWTDSCSSRAIPLDVWVLLPSEDKVFSLPLYFPPQLHIGLPPLLSPRKPIWGTSTESCAFFKISWRMFFGLRIWFLINQCSSSVAQQLPFWNLGFPKEELSKWQECPLASPTDNTIHPKICPPPPVLLAKSANIAEKSREFADRHQVLRQTGYIYGEGTRKVNFCDITAEREREGGRERVPSTFRGRAVALLGKPLCNSHLLSVKSWGSEGCQKGGRPSFSLDYLCCMGGAMGNPKAFQSEPIGPLSSAQKNIIAAT